MDVTSYLRIGNYHQTKISQISFFFAQDRSPRSQPEEEAKEPPRSLLAPNHPHPPSDDEPAPLVGIPRGFFFSHLLLPSLGRIQAVNRGLARARPSVFQSAQSVRMMRRRHAAGGSPMTRAKREAQSTHKRSYAAVSTKQRSAAEQKHWRPRKR